MRKVVLHSVLLASLFSGCTSPFTHKPLFDAQQSQKDVAPITSEVPADATYALVSIDNLDATPITYVHLSRGDRYGFRRGSDRAIVAVAGKQTFPVPDGTFGWVVVDGRSLRSSDKPEENVHRVGQAVKVVGDVLYGVGYCTFYVAGLLRGGLNSGSWGN